MLDDRRTSSERAQDALTAVTDWQQHYLDPPHREAAHMAGPDERFMAKQLKEALERAETARAGRQGAPRPDLHGPRSGSSAPADLVEATTIVLGYRHSWARERLARELTQSGFLVQASLDDAAEGLGTCIAEQPDLLLVEERLPSLTCLQVLALTRRYAPHTLVAVHTADTADTDSVSALLLAGASLTFRRDTSAELICQQLLAVKRRTPTAVSP